MKRGNFGAILVLFVWASLFGTNAGAQNTPPKDEKTRTITTELETAKTAERKSDAEGAIKAYERVLEMDPHNFQAHIGIINLGKNLVLKEYQEKPGFGTDEKLMKELSDRLDAEGKVKWAKFEKLAKEHPNKAVYRLILANMNAYEPAKMQEYLNQAQRLEPDNIDVLRQVGQFEKLKGNNARASEIFKKISDLDPQDETAAFTYYYSLSDVDPQQFKQKSEEFIKRFPTSERGAVLYSQIAEKGSAAEKLTYLERLKASFPPAKNRTSMGAMSDLLAVYLQSSNDRALTFAREMLSIAPDVGKKEWQGHIEFITAYQEVESLLAEQKAAEALQSLEKIKASGRSAPARIETLKLSLLKSRVQAANGQGGAAYEGLMAFYVKNPADELRTELRQLGKALGKNDDEVEEDIQAGVAELAKPIKDFSLSLYDSDKNVSLADYRGKVVLLNFWYPLCGPCHAEAPYIQKLVEKYGKDRFVVLAPNAFPNQDSLVVPFFKGNKYDFIPLKVPDNEYLRREYQIRGYPTNYLIDKKGNRVFETGNVSPGRLRQIELMVEMLLVQKS